MKLTKSSEAFRDDEGNRTLSPFDRQWKELLEHDHLVLRENTLVKEALTDEKLYSEKILEITQQLGTSVAQSDQARLLALLIELDVRDTTRIGESLFDTLRYDLETKAQGDFEFVKGERNLAMALLQLINESPDFLNFISQTCDEQEGLGLATPFDYRRLTLQNRKELEEMEVDDWVAYFHGLKNHDMRGLLEIGRSFASTKEKRYSDEEEGIIQSRVGDQSQSLLDIGGSIGVSATYLAKLLSIPEVTVTDYRSREELERCFYGSFQPQEDIKYILGEQGDIVLHTPDSKQYDLVTVNNVLVHIRNKEAAVNNILSRLGDDGYLVISGGYNTNPPRKGFWFFQIDKEGLVLLNQ